MYTTAHTNDLQVISKMAAILASSPAGTLQPSEASLSQTEKEVDSSMPDSEAADASEGLAANLDEGEVD